MKKIFLFILSIVSLTGCSKIIEMVTESDTQLNNDFPIEENASELPITSSENSLDERFMIEDAVKHQRELYKFGFMSDSFHHMNTSLVYYPLENTFGYSSMYKIPHKQTYFKFEAGTSFDLTLYDSMTKQLINPQQIHNHDLKLLYGKYNAEHDEDYYILGQNKNTTYILQIGSEEEGYSDEIVQLIAESLRLETDGAFDPLYENVTMDFEQIQFPSMNEERVTIHDVELTVNNADNVSEILITYLLSKQDSITYHIETTPPDIKDTYDKVDTITTSNGTKVKQFISTNNKQQHVFQWVYDTYTYTMITTLNDEEMIHLNEMIEIIESAQSDTRNFDDKSFFKPLLKNTPETHNDKKLIKLLENMTTSQ